MRIARQLLATLILCFALFPALLSAREKGTILIASEKTRFKDLLVTELDSLFTAAGYSTTIIAHTKNGLDKYNAADFSAVFITNSGVNSRVRPWVTSWIDRNRDRGTYILLHTTQIRDWDVVAPVDAVTSASVNADVTTLAQSYFLQITRELDSSGTAR